MIVLIDTNVVFDVIGKRQPHYAASNQIMCLCRRCALRSSWLAFTPASALPNQTYQHVGHCANDQPIAVLGCSPKANLLFSAKSEKRRRVLEFRNMMRADQVCGTGILPVWAWARSPGADPARAARAEGPVHRAPARPRPNPSPAMPTHGAGLQPLGAFPVMT